MEELLAKFHADRLSLDTQIAELTDLANDRKCEIESLKEQLDPLQEECSQNYREKYEALKEMIEPFKVSLVTCSHLFSPGKFTTSHLFLLSGTTRDLRG